MDIQEVLKIADRLVFHHTGKHLDNLQKTILQGVWQGKKYTDIAENMAYTEDGKKRLKRLMEIVRNHHTFLNRLNTLQKFIEDYAGDFALVWGGGL